MADLVHRVEQRTPGRKRKNKKCAVTHTQRVHVGIWYLLEAQRGSHIPTLRSNSYMDPVGEEASKARKRAKKSPASPKKSHVQRTVLPLKRDSKLRTQGGRKRTQQSTSVRELLALDITLHGAGNTLMT